MEIINYHPWTLIYLNLSPSIGIVGNWGQWSDSENNLIKQISKTDRKEKLTILNFVLTKNEAPLVSNKGIESLAEHYKINQIVNYSVPLRLETQSEAEFLSNFEPLINMLHLNKIYILENYPLLKFMQKIYPPQNLVIVPNTNSQVFSQRLKNDLAEGQLEDYCKLVGANYSFKGTVEQGDKSGRKIGYPTANILVKPKLPIRSGVYLVKITLPNEDKFHWGLGDYRMLENHDWVFETFILDFDQEIYGWVINTELVAFHRDNIAATSLSQLKELIREDEITLKKLIKKFEER